MITCNFWENKIAGKIDAQVSNPEDMRREGRRGWGGGCLYVSRVRMYFARIYAV